MRITMKPVTIKCDSTEGIKLCDINNESVCLQSLSPMNIGQNLDFDVPLPGNLSVLHVTGKVTRVVPMNERTQRSFRCYMKIGTLDDVNRKILSAYVEYREGEKILDEAFTAWEIYKQYLMLLLTKKNPNRWVH
jgi:hypothetical protein